ncbi:MAG: cytochrome d ubiquinol oxidase subunit II [Spirochaetes bacterium]|jgi:cytochrome d ubiquinol oxidase subunit II|nr:cytochrome d ubiquinol oxidase subunit II [Spirochaetota bacterium]
MAIENLQIIWFLVLGLLLAGYSVLDGFDLGIGSLLPFLSDGEMDDSTLFNSIGPVWDGNEVWLITAGGALFAAFPHAYATVFSGFYLPFMILLFALVFRAVSLEFWSLDEKRKRIWRMTFTAGSLTASLIYGVALGNVIAGIPIEENMEYAGGFMNLLNPFSLTIGLLGLSAILLQGSTYASIKTSGGLLERARNLSKKIWIAYAAIVVISMILASIYVAESRKPAVWVCSSITVFSLILNRVFINLGKDLASFITSSSSLLGLWAISGSILFPNLVKASNNPDYNLTIYNSSSGQLTLTVMLIIAAIGMPIVIAYSVYIYRVFKGKTVQN